MAFLYGVSGSARQVSDMFIGIDGIARRVKAAYIGIDGKARIFYGGEYIPEINEVVAQCAGTGTNTTSNVIYPAGRYKVEIAGYPSQDPTYYTSDNCFEYEAVVTQPFNIVGYCGDTATMDDLGLTYAADSNGGIFGGGAGIDAAASVVAAITDGNSLSAYGAVCHFIPVGGTFGTDYLWCFHCAPTPKGGAYGGGCGGYGAVYTYARPGASVRIVTATGHTGGNGTGGNGGVGGIGTVSGGSGSGPASGKPGTAGSGVGAGTPTSGGVAVYNGTYWLEPTRKTDSRATSYIRVTYLGAN